MNTNKPSAQEIIQVNILLQDFADNYLSKLPLFNEPLTNIEESIVRTYILFQLRKHGCPPEEVT